MSSTAFAKRASPVQAVHTAHSPAVSGDIRIGDPSDGYEREAEHLSDEIMSGGPIKRHWSLPRPSPDTSSLRRCSCGSSGSAEGECAACKEAREADAPVLHRKAAGHVVSGVAPPIVHRVLSSSGQPLDKTTRDYFEPRLGHDLGMVRIHADSMAAQSAGSVDAKAYTVGSHIAFADGQFAPATSVGKALLGHELVHVAQQATHAPIHLARAPEAYVSPYTEALANELLQRVQVLRIAAGGATIRQQANRVAAVAALFDRQGNRLGTIERLNAPGAHAEDLVVQEVRNRIAAGEKIEYTVLMVDQDPCPGLCAPMLKEWHGNPESGTLRVIQPMAVNKRDPSKMVSGKTAYTRLEEGPVRSGTVPVDPKTPPPNNEAFIGTRGDLSRVRPPLYKPSPPPSGAGSINPPPSTGATADVAADVSSDATSAAARALGKGEEQAAEHALEDTAAKRVSSQLGKAAEKDLSEVAAEALTTSATSQATRRLGQAVAPAVGVVFAAPDIWRGVTDLTHGDFVLGVGTIGVALVDVASTALHFTDEITAGGGTILAITIQTWAATMQFGFESARIHTRAAELKAYMKAHNGRLPPDSELTSYYGMNDEDILILKNDLYKAGQHKVTTEDLAKEVRGLLAQIDANASKPLPEGVTPEDIQKERASLSKLLVALDADVEKKHAKDAADRAASEAKRRQADFDRAQQQQKQAAQTQAQASERLLPPPGAPQQQSSATANDPFSILSPQEYQPLNGISQHNAELGGTGFGRARDALLARYQQLASEHMPEEKVAAYRKDVAEYVNALDQVIAMFTSKGSKEWAGVKEMQRLRAAADDSDRSQLMR